MFKAISKVLSVVIILMDNDSTRIAPEKLSVYASLINQCGDDIDEQCVAAYEIAKDVSILRLNDMSQSDFMGRVFSSFSEIDRQA
ncbi:hypothetical protein [Citrobacter sp. MGH110]|uniref:hypothetical protein n=1 Tax=Citrobacter sp. MGH110 TaxID=1686383 RepID=UPI0006520609|nr:hypothetical protein [Citrobacter sp. MGH110]KLV75593.1 hypothetical protein SK38_01443 [Citrobacter sp. MGH110]